MESKLGPALAQRLAKADSKGRFKVQIFLHRGATPAGSDNHPTDRAAVILTAKKETERSLKLLADSFAPVLTVKANNQVDQVPFRELWRHWINNSIAAEVSLATVLKILEHPDVEQIELISHERLEDLLHGATGRSSVSPSDSPAGSIANQVTLVQAPLLWNEGLRGDGVLIAVIDSGVDFHHPDLAGRRWDARPEISHHGFDFEVPGRLPSDEIGHGTSCAGLIAGDGTSGFTTGVAPKATLMALRVGGVEAQVWSAFQFAMEHGVDIISMSMGWSSVHNPNYTGWRKACINLMNAGMTLVCSAGNDGLVKQFLEMPRNIAAPAVCPPSWLNPVQRAGGRSAAIACGETNLMDQRVTTSSCGPAAWEIPPFVDYPFQNGNQGLLKPDLCGPGRGSMTCNPDFGRPGQALHRPFGGTSAAAAVVAGCAALLINAAKRSGRPVLPHRVHQALEETAVPIQGQVASKQNDSGAGRVDVAEAYKFGLRRGFWG